MRSDQMFINFTAVLLNTKEVAPVLGCCRLPTFRARKQLPTFRARDQFRKAQNGMFTYLITYLLTYLLHGAESFLRS